MIEIWMKIEGLEEYAFSNYGRIYNYKTQEYSVGTLNKKTGYYEKILRKDCKYFKGGGIHKFIYEAFKGKIPKGLEVNHIDGNKSNNAIWNLNLMTHSENRKWMTKKVYQYTLDGEFIDVYDSTIKASEETGIPDKSITHACLDKCFTAQSYIWSYSNDESVIKEKVKNNYIKWKDISFEVEQYTKNGKFVAEYKSMREAERQTGISHCRISMCCNGKIKATGGYVWKIKEAA